LRSRSVFLRKRLNELDFNNQAETSSLSIANEAYRHHRDELWVLGRSFLKMRELIFEKIDSLKQLHQIIEEQNRTSELLSTFLRDSKLPSFTQANQLAQAHLERIGEFVTQDPQGQQLLPFYFQLEKLLCKEQEKIKKEVHRIQQSVALIKDVVDQQQEHAKVGLFAESLDLAVLVDRALVLGQPSLSRHQITLLKEYEATPPVKVQKSKLIHIFANLIKNAIEALEKTPPEDRQITINIGKDDEKNTYVKVKDNGIGITQENLTNRL